MPHVKVLIHFVWSTKNRAPLLSDKIRKQVFQHIKEKADEKKIFIECINGHVDHVHCVISLGTTQIISKVIQQIKGECSHWINENKISERYFEWQDEYWGASISFEDLKIVRNYIKGQEEHHRKVTFQQELDDLIKEWGFERFDDIK